MIHYWILLQPTAGDRGQLIRPPSRLTGSDDHHSSHSQDTKCKILIDWPESESLYWIRQKSVTRIQCALGHVNAVSTRNRQNDRACCQTTTVSHLPQSSSAFASLHVVRAATMSVSFWRYFGWLEFAGVENDGPFKNRGWNLQDWKMTEKSQGWNLKDWKMTDKVAGVEFAGLENDG